ncbi:MAG: ABC transporter permease [Bacteroidota bacterium]
MLLPLLKRIIQGVLVLWGIVSILFLIFYTFGDPVDYLVEDNVDADTKAAIRAKYGLDQSIWMQYGTYIHQLLPIGGVPMADQREVPHLGIFSTDKYIYGLKAPNLGRSYQSNTPVAKLIGQRIEGTLILAGTAITFAAFLGIFLGVIAAIDRDSWRGQTILSLSVLGISAPSFFVGVLVAWIFAVKGQSWTGLSVTGFIFEPEIFGEGRQVVWGNLILPALALGIRPLAVIIQLTRSAMLEALSSGYVQTAKAKGLSRFKVVTQHALRNALNPVITSLTSWLASLLAGAFFIEYIFNWQGIGKLTIDALNQNDFPIIIGCALFIGLVFVVVNIVTDFLYALLDPRVKVS